MGAASVVLKVAPMTVAGIRELRLRASELLGRVARGETIEITDRGRPVALLSPLPERSRLDRLRAAGEIEPAIGGLEDLPEPLDLAPGVEPPSEVLARLRRHAEAGHGSTTRILVQRPRQALSGH